MFYLIAVSNDTGLTPSQFIDCLYNSDEIQVEQFECHGWNDNMYFKSINKKVTGVTSIRYRGQDIVIQPVPKFRVNGSINYDINSLIGSVCRFLGVIVQHSGETNPATFYCPIGVSQLLLSSKIEEYSFVAVTGTQNYEFFFSVSKSFPTTPDAIISSLQSQEDIDDVVRVSESHLETLPEWYFKSNNPQIQDVDSVKIARKAITFVHVNALPAAPPMSRPVLPPPASELNPNQYFIEIFHDAENCPCVGIKPTGTFNNMIRRVLLSLLNGDSTAADAIDITSSVIVKWNFVISPDKMNTYNRPSDKFRNEMASVYGGIWIDPGQKTDAVDTKIKELLSNYQRSLLPYPYKIRCIALLY